MISKFSLRNFKCHRDTQLELGRFTMLVGDNASGKTSVLDALALQASIGDNPVRVLRGILAPEDLLRRGSDEAIILSSEGVRGGQFWKTAFTLQVKSAESAGAKPVKSWELTVAGEFEGASFSASASGSDGGGNRLGTWDRLEKTLGTAVVYRLQPDRIANAAYSNQPDTRIEADGTNTAVALAAMKLGDDETFQRIEDAMRKLVPSMRRIRIRPATVHRRTTGDDIVGSKLYFDFLNAPGIPAHGASHGTLILVALLAILHGSNPPNVILLDDFDHALHPRAQMELVRMIRQLLALDEFGDMQIVMTTHSPYTLDEVDPSDAYVFALRDDGTVASKRLSEHPEAERTRGTLKSGQLWSLDPERDWVLQG